MYTPFRVKNQTFWSCILISAIRYGNVKNTAVLTMFPFCFYYTLPVSKSLAFRSLYTIKIYFLDFHYLTFLCFRRLPNGERCSGKHQVVPPLPARKYSLPAIEKGDRKTLPGGAVEIPSRLAVDVDLTGWDGKSAERDQLPVLTLFSGRYPYIAV